jgi:hypothetical protein
MTPKERIRESLYTLPPARRIVVLCLGLGVAAILIWALIGGARNLFDRLRFDARVARAEAARIEADARAEEARRQEAVAIATRIEAERKYAEATVRAEIAEAALAGARSVTVRVRQEYDETRNRDLSAVSADTDELCARLRDLGYACRRAVAPVR